LLARRPARRLRPGLLLDDLSGGAEAVPIPLFNELDSEQSPAFEYCTAYRIDDEATRRAAAVGEAAAGRAGWCAPGCWLPAFAWPPALLQTRLVRPSALGRLAARLHRRSGRRRGAGGRRGSAPGPPRRRVLTPPPPWPPRRPRSCAARWLAHPEAELYNSDELLVRRRQGLWAAAVQRYGAAQRRAPGCVEQQRPAADCMGTARGLAGRGARCSLQAAALEPRSPLQLPPCHGSAS
jgi:hypothetical protein